MHGVATEHIPMNRREMIGMAGAVSAYALASQVQAQEPQQEADPWIGTYFKFSRYDTDRIGQFGEAQTITITKERDGYALSKPYARGLFLEKAKGVLSDGQGGLGTIYLGTVEYADGKKESMLRVEFCYEDFYLCRKRTGDEVKKSPPDGK